MYLLLTIPILLRDFINGLHKIIFGSEYNNKINFHCTCKQTIGVKDIEKDLIWGRVRLRALEYALFCFR